jgi:hypothetical protein
VSDPKVRAHRHGGTTRWAYTHAHAYPDVPHNHILRAVCSESECEGCQTHNIHSDGKEDDATATD